MKNEDISQAQGHWILARMGKKVLRPGGRDLTEKLIQSLNITHNDEIAEFAPGLGFTAALALKKSPKSYIGIDADENAVKFLNQKIKGKHISFVQGNAAHTQILSESKDKVYGEAMLTMHADHRKSEIIQEAHRILKSGGTYAIHELGLFPSNITEEVKSEIQKDLALAIKVNARPLTETEWRTLLEKEGFKITNIQTNKMRLLEPGRIIHDEGFFRTLKIGYNILTNSKARKRIFQMRKTFTKHKQHINAVAITAEKI